VEIYQAFQSVLYVNLAPDLLNQLNIVALTDNLDGRNQFDWICHYFNYWWEWEGNMGFYHMTNDAMTQEWLKQLSLSQELNWVETDVNTKHETPSLSIAWIE